MAAISSNNVSLTGSLVELAVAGLATDPKLVGLGYGTARLNIWGTSFTVQIQAQMWDGTWDTLPASNAINGNDAGSTIATSGKYDFDVGGWQYVKAVITGDANVKGAFLL